MRTPLKGVQDTARILRIAAVHWWYCTEEEAKAVVKAVVTSQFERPRQLRHHLALLNTPIRTADGTATYIDFPHVFGQRFGPVFVMAMLEDLALEGTLDRTMARDIEERILDAVNAKGIWK